MRFLVFGGTGPSGLLVVRETLAVYPQSMIVIYARSPNKVPDDLRSSTSIVVIQGQLDDIDVLTKAMEGVDVILSALGPLPSHPSNTPLAHGYHNIIELMHKLGIKRLLALGTASIKDPKDQFSWKYSALIKGVKTLAPNAYKDIVAIGDVIRTEGSDLQWTLVRVPILTNKEDQAVMAGYVGDGKISTFLSRHAFATFMVEEVKRMEWVNCAPMICSE